MNRIDELKLAIYESSFDLEDKNELLNIVESADDEEILESVEDLLITESKNGSAHTRYINSIQKEIDDLKASINKKISFFNKSTSTDFKDKLQQKINAEKRELESLNKKLYYYGTGDRIAANKNDITKKLSEFAKRNPNSDPAETSEAGSVRRGKKNFLNKFGGNTKSDTRQIDLIK